MKDTLEKNGVVLCSACSPKPGHYQHLKPEFFLFKDVKKSFPVENGKVKAEHMWVRVISVEGETLIGKLSNDPWYIPKAVLKSGDTVKLTVAEIESVIGLD